MKTIHFLSFLAILAFVIIITAGCNRVSKYNSGSKPITHEIYDSLLKAHVTEEGWVDYKGFIRDSVKFQKYLHLLENHHPNEKFWTKSERLAYWINAYNAFTIDLIMRNYPVESIKDIKNGIPFVNTVWDIKFIQIEGKEYDLNNIEHGIIRRFFDEPRIHFAVNCASYSCPRLLDEAYTADRLDEQLTLQTKAFLTDEKKNQLDPKNPKLSKLFKWYSGDFEREGQSKIDFINQYSPVQIQEDANIDYLDYGWSLNDVAIQKSS